jgi:signal peptidase II
LEDRLKQRWRDYLWLFTIVAIIVTLDQVTKAIVRANLSVGETWMPWAWLAPYFRFVHWYNTGVAFGMFQGLGMVFAALAAVVIVVIAIYFPRIPRSDWLTRLALAMQMAGAMGNLIDRLTQQGRVTDFVSLGTFAVFNVADASITVGVGVLLLAVWLQERRERKAQTETPDAPQSEDLSVEEEHA